MSTVWPHLRAALVVLHVVAITLIALPSPGSGLDRRSWKNATVQAEFQDWVHRLNSWGVAIEQPEFEDKLWIVASSVQSTRDTVLTPFKPYYKYAGTWQSWKMFVAPHRFPGRLVIEVKDHGQYKTIYRGRSSEANWRRRWFDHDRMRATVFRYGWRRYSNHRRAFVSFIAKEVAKDYPEVTSVRVYFERYKTLSAEDVLAGKSAKITKDLQLTMPVKP